MKKLIISIVFLACFASLPAPGLKELPIARGEGINPYLRILNAIYDIESSKGVNLLNEKENAVGGFGIRLVRLQDYNKRTGSNLKHIDCYEYETSKKICLYYISQVDYCDIKAISIAWNGVSKRNLYYAKLKSRL